MLGSQIETLHEKSGNIKKKTRTTKRDVRLLGHGVALLERLSDLIDPRPRTDEALSYLDWAEEYFNAGTRSRMGVKPVLLYYSVLNLAKC